MTDEKLVSKIFEKIKKDPADTGAYEDLFSICLETGDHGLNGRLRELAVSAIRDREGDMDRLFGLYRRSLLLDAPVDLDSYLLYSSKKSCIPQIDKKNTWEDWEKPFDSASKATVSTQFKSAAQVFKRIL